MAKPTKLKEPFFFKQITSAKSGVGADPLGKIEHNFPPPPFGTWVSDEKEAATSRRNR